MRRALPFALIIVAVFGAAALGGRGSAGPIEAAAPSPTPTPTPTATPPSSLPARFFGKVTFVNGLKAPAKTGVSVYTSATTKCADGTATGSSYAVNVPLAADKAGCPAAGGTVYFKLGEYWAQEQGAWTRGVPSELNLTFPKLQPYTLAAGCNNIAMQFPTGTAVKTIAESIDPKANLVALWKWNGADWDGYFPAIPASLSTLKTVGFLDVVWMCTTDQSTFNQPALSP